MAPIRSDARRSGKYPPIVREEIKKSSNINSPALIIIEKRPRVRIINGPNINFKIGRIKILIKPRIAAAMIKSLKPPVKENPCINCAAANIPTVFEKI